MSAHSKKPEKFYLNLVSNLFKSSEEGLTYFAAFLLGTLVILVAVGIFSRISGVRIPGVIEFSAFILIALVFLPLAAVTRRESHVRVQIFSERFSPRAKRVVTISTSLMALAAIALIAILCWQMFFETLESGSVTVGSPHIVLWVPQLPVALGMSLVCIRMAIDLLKDFLGDGN